MRSFLKSYDAYSCQNISFARILLSPPLSHKLLWKTVKTICRAKMLAIIMKTDPAQRKSNMFRCPIFWLVFFRSRQKPFVIRSSLQAHSLLLLLLSLSGWWCVKCALSFLALILKNLACKDFTCLATVSLHMHGGWWRAIKNFLRSQNLHIVVQVTCESYKSLAPKMVVCLSPYCMINNSSLAKDFFLSHILHAKAIPF